MSRKCDRCCYPYPNRGMDNCGSGCCNFPSFIILILILLTFGKKSDCSLQGSSAIDKGLLFIIALYYLCCCSPCNKRY